MGKRRPDKRRYSDEERSDALAALAANGGNVALTAKRLGIPPKTLANWAKGVSHPEAAVAAEAKKGPLADRLEAVAWQIADAIPAKLETAPLQQLAVTLGIVVDKMRLLRDQATAISRAEGGADDLRDLTDDELERRKQEALRRAGAAGAAEGPR